MVPRSTTRPSNARPPTAKVLLPVRYAAWMNGDLGRSLERTLRRTLDGFADLRITRLPRGFLVESHEAPGPLLEAVHRAALHLESDAAAAYPVFHHEIGPVWTGTLQSVFEDAPAPAPCG